MEASAERPDDMEAGADHVCVQECGDARQEVFWVDSDGDVRLGVCLGCEWNDIYTRFVVVEFDELMQRTPRDDIYDSNPDGNPLFLLRCVSPA